MVNNYGDDYAGAVMAQANGIPLTDLQYVAWVMAQTSTNQLTGSANAQSVDNTTGHWTPAQQAGNTYLLVPHSDTQTIYFLHSAYIGPQQTTSGAALSLPAGNARALVGTEDWSGWEIVLVGVAIAAVGILSFGTAVPVLAAVGLTTAAALTGVGLAAVVLGLTYVAFTPTVIGNTCNATSTSCVLTTSSLGGENVTTIDCSSPDVGCNATTTSVGGIGNALVGIGIGVAVIVAAGVGGYAVYKVVSAHKFGPRQATPYYPPPAPPAPRPT
jgi:hypothetical protein